MNSDSNLLPQIIILSEDERQAAPLKDRLAHGGFKPDVISFFDLRERNRISKSPALLILNFHQGVATNHDWDMLILLLSHVHTLFPDNYTILLTPLAAPRFLARIGLTACREVHLAKPDDAAVADAVADALRGGALPSMEPILTLPQRVLDVCGQIGSYQQPKALAQMIVSQMTEVMDADRSSVWLRATPDAAPRLIASHGLPDEVVRQAGPPPDGSIISWVVSNNQPLLLHENIRNTRFQSVSHSVQMKSSVCLPIAYRDEVMGVFTLGRTRPQAPYFSHGDMQACLIVASTAAVSLQNAHLIAELIQRERLATVGQTIAGVAHCMKNIFTALNGGLFLLEHGLTRKDWAECSKSHDVLQRSSSRLNMLVMNMLDYSKSRKPVLEEIHLRELFDEICHLIVPAARQRHIDVQVDVDPEADLVYLDQPRLYRAIVNLATNAIDAMFEGGVLTLRARPRGEPIHTGGIEDDIGGDNREGGVMLKRRPVTIEVKDTGLGIPAEALPNIFEPFFSTKGSKGTGLGLASVKQFVDEQGGRIEIDTAPGAGTTFRLIF